MKVFITDDHSVMFDGFRVLFKHIGFEIAGTATRGIGLLNWLEHNTCDVIILDLSMPEMSGIEVLQKLATKDNVPNVLIVSGTYDMNQVQDAILFGAKGFVLKSEIHLCAEEAIRKVSVGKHYFSEVIKDQIILKQLESESRVTIENLLSKREYEALKLLTNNLDTKEICEEMNITPSSFRTLTARMRVKLGVKKNIGLVILALKHNFFKKK